MPEQINGLQFLFLFCGTLIVAGFVTFLIILQQMKQEKLLPHNSDSE
jgi:hypothetical protein